MKPIVLLTSSTAGRILLLLLCLHLVGFRPQPPLKDNSEDLTERLACFERLVNSVLDGQEQRVQFDPFFMDEQDLEYWMGQFEFSDEVLEQVSPEGFYNKLEGWAGSAQSAFLSSIDGADRLEIANSEIKTDSDPRLRVNKLVNVAAHTYRGDVVSGRLFMTLIDVRGQLKLIQAELR